MMGLLTKFVQRSLENPSTPLSSPDDWLFDALGSFRASSGVNVNRETALTYDAYWRCIALISGDVAKLPMHVYRHDAKGVKTHDDDHPADYLLSYEFNEDICALDCKRMLTFHGMAEGNGYGYIVRGADARPLEIWPLSPMKTYPVRRDQVLWYITEVGGKERKIPADDMLHIKGLSFDGLVGYSAVAKMREALGLGLGAENFGNIFFRNNARPNIVLKHPGRLKPEARLNIRESWERIHSGLENAHRTAVLEEGMDLVPIMHNARDSQLLELRQFSRIQICNFFGVPPHKVGDDAKTSYNSLEQENQEYLNDGGGLGFWLAAWESECRKKLLTVPQKQRRTHTIEFQKRKLLRADLQVRTGYYTAMIQQGVLSPDEVRAEEGLNPRPDGKGGDFVTPTAPQQAKGDLADQGDKPGDKGPAKGDKGDPGAKGDQGAKGRDGRPGKDASLRGVLSVLRRERCEDAARRLVRRLSHAAERAANNPSGFGKFMDDLESEHLADARESLARFGGDASCLLGAVRAELLEVSGLCRPGELPAMVRAKMASLEALLPSHIAYRGRKPLRTAKQALEVLARLPDVEPGAIAVMLTVDKLPDFDPKDLKKAKATTVRIGELCATQATVTRDHLSQAIRKGGKESSDNPVTLSGQGGKLMEGLPGDLPYVVEDDECYIFDGHHRITAMQLLGCTKIKVYYLKV